MTGGLLVGNVLRHAAQVTPHALAATLDDEELTFADLDAAANRTAHVLRDLGIRHGDRVAWWGETSLAVVELFAALAKLGAVFAPVNGRLSADEALNILDYALPGCSSPMPLAPRASPEQIRPASPTTS